MLIGKSYTDERNESLWSLPSTLVVGGALSYMGYIGMCGLKGYGFLADGAGYWF